MNLSLDVQTYLGALILGGIAAFGIGLLHLGRIQKNAFGAVLALAAIIILFLIYGVLFGMMVAENPGGYTNPLPGTLSIILQPTIFCTALYVLRRPLPEPKQLRPTLIRQSPEQDRQTIRLLKNRFTRSASPPEINNPKGNRQRWEVAARHPDIPLRNDETSETRA